MQKKTFYILSIFLLVSNFSIGQSNSKNELKVIVYDSVLHKQIYRIEVGVNQLVELVEFNNGEFDGNLTNAVWKINRDESRSKIITQKIKIPSLTVKKLMTKLREQDFEIIPDCNDVKGCIDGLDGTGVAFFFLKKAVSRVYSYWEPENDYYYTKDKMIPEVLKLRQILKTINSEFNLSESQKAFHSKLPNGKYTYGMLVMEKK
jgi:hypothetical protein